MNINKLLLKILNQIGEIHPTIEELYGAFGHDLKKTEKLLNEAQYLNFLLTCLLKYYPEGYREDYHEN